MDDLISRQAVIKAIFEKPALHGPEGSFYHYKDIEDAVNSLPQVQKERATGKWILSDCQRREDTDNGNYQYFCSNCLHSDIHSKTAKVPYCWSCGAKMEVE